MHLAEFNFLVYLDNLEWRWRFLTNIYQGENPQIISILL